MTDISEDTSGAESEAAPKRSRATGFAWLSFAFALLVTAAAVMAGFGSQWGWWHFRTGLAILKWSGYGGLAAVFFTLVSSIWSGLAGSRFGFAIALIGLLISLSVSGTLWQWKEKARRVPRIHDITTDTENPPAFVAVLPLRKDAANPPEYGGPEIAAKQKAGYPEIAPVILPVPANEAFQKALAAAVGMNWQIIDANQAEGRIEATDTTFWFGFKDDIVIRVTPDRSGSRIDVRSVSRVGLSDVGTNAERIKRFVSKIRR